MTPAMKALIIDHDLEKPIEERLDMFYNYLQKKKGEVDGALDQLDSKAVVQEAERLEIKDKAGLLLCRGLFDGNVLTEIDNARKLLLRFLCGQKKAQRYFLGGIEQLVTAKENKETLLPKVPHILQKLYEADILEEETILEWGKKASKKYVSRKESEAIIAKAEPFLKWLAEAESESDSEDEDEAVAFENEKQPAAPPAKPVSNGVARPAPAAVQNGAADEDDDDFDIDDI
jgi:translation initiation factor 5